MLLDHRSGIPEWDTPDIDDQIAHHPAKIWTIGEKLDLAAAQPPVFAARHELQVLEHRLHPARA